MPGSIDPAALASPAAQAAIKIIQHLRTHGQRAYMVGGCVRDLLLGREVKDFDVATSATPDQVIDLFPRAERVGAHFGVVLVLEAGQSVEVATFRTESSYNDGRHPGLIRFETEPEADVRRRDFTINGLMLDPESREVLDWVGGREDLERGVVRAIGDPKERFEEDHLRMLRGVRFAARFGFEIEPDTYRAIRLLAPNITRISPERIRDELVKMLTEGRARRALELLDETGLLSVLLPEVAAMKGVQQPPEYHPEGDVWTHTLIMMEELEEPTAALAFGVLLHDVGKPPTFRVAERIRFDGHVEAGVEIARRILERLRFSNDDIEQVLALVSNHMRFSHVHEMRESTLRRFLRLPRFSEHLELHRLDCASSHGNLHNYEFARAKLAELPAEALRPIRLLTGNDLIAAGYKPGPRFSEILREAEDAQLESRIATREEALEFVRQRFGPPPASDVH